MNIGLQVICSPMSQKIYFIILNKQHLSQQSVINESYVRVTPPVHPKVNGSRDLRWRLIGWSHVLSLTSLINVTSPESRKCWQQPAWRLLVGSLDCAVELLAAQHVLPHHNPNPLTPIVSHSSRGSYRVIQSAYTVRTVFVRAMQLVSVVCPNYLQLTARRADVAT